MIERIKISRIGFFDKDKQGNPLRTRDNKPYERCLIETVDGRKVSGFGNPTSRTWKQGDEVEIDIEKKGEYWNFKTVKKESGINQDQIDRIEKMVAAIHSHILNNSTAKATSADNRSALPDYPEEEINPEDIPF